MTLFYGKKSDGELKAVEVSDSGEIKVVGGTGGGGSGASAAEIKTAIETATTLDGIEPALGSPSDSPATSNVGTFGLIALIKRVIAHLFAPRIDFTVQVSVSGVTQLIAAPPSGQRIVITKMQAQSEGTTAFTAILRDGTAAIKRVRCPVDGSGIAELYDISNVYRLSAATALNTDQSAAVACGYSIEYYLEVVATGLPV